jgi:TetR/AcrR family transcriptional regulator
MTKHSAARAVQARLARSRLDLASPGRRLPAKLADAKRPETVRRILQAAESVFAERGLAGARIDAIARAARVNKALLYYYFGSKEALHRATLEMLFSELRAQAGMALDRSAAPAEQVLGYVNGFFDFVSAHPNYPRLVQREVMGRGAGLAWIVQEYFQPLYRRLATAVREGAESGEFRRVDPPQAVLTIIAMTAFYFAAAAVLAELWQCDPLAPARVAARRQAVIDFLEHGLFAVQTRKR